MSQTLAPSIALSTPLTGTVAKARAWRIPRRPLKLSAAGVLLMAGAYGAFSEQLYVDSSDAVVSAYVLDVRAPIAGMVTGLPRSAGALVHAGDVLGGLRNDLVNQEHLDNLRTLENVADSNAAADYAELHALAAQQEELLHRSYAHRDAVADRMVHAVAEARSTLAAAEQQHAQTLRDLERGRVLHGEGIIAHADYDRLVTAESVAKRQMEAQQQAVLSLEGQHTAAMSGLMSEPGTNNDVAYSRQRADELAFKITEVRRSLAASQAQASQAQLAVGNEGTRAMQMHSSEVRSPIDGQVWQVNAMDGERMNTGDAMISLVDCSRQFLLAEVPQDRLPQIAIGGTARFRLAGETAERTGIVLAASGDPQKEINHKFAAFPLGDPAQQLATVRVTMSGTGNTCSVGRAAHVVLPTQPTSFASRMVRHWF